MLDCFQDEKIRDILGHFQKDFEGGVSAENLGKIGCAECSPKEVCPFSSIESEKLFYLTGSKFGGYGSFLPTHPRFPTIWSHSKSPGRLSNHNNPISPHTPPAEVSVLFLFIYYCFGGLRHFDVV